MSADWAFRLLHPDLRPKAREWRGQPFRHADLKLDGHRLTLYRGAGGERMALGRKLHVDLWERLPQDLRDAVDELPECTVVDGELCGRDTSSDVVTALIDGTADYWAFALPRMAGQDMRAGDHEQCRRLLEVAGFAVPESGDFFLDTDHRVCSDLTRRAMENSMCEWAGVRGEGVVLKAGHYSGWYKVKPVLTCDLVVTGWALGEGKHAGRLGALTVSRVDDRGKHVVVGPVGGGFSDEERELPASRWLGQVVEVAYDRVAADGGLRFPRFVRLRPDKRPDECRGEELRSGEEEKTAS